MQEENDMQRLRMVDELGGGDCMAELFMFLMFCLWVGLMISCSKDEKSDEWLRRRK